jgi:crossover junction endodeoxyribonuclease RuvC
MMSRPGKRVLGIDTSLRSTGIAVVEAQGSSLRHVDCATLKTSPKWLHSACLKHIAEGISNMIAESQPQEASIEGAFFFKNAKTAMVLGEARGVAIATCAAHGLPVYEYAPRRVKQAVVGVGSAEKHQVARMVMRLLGLTDEPQQDAADALAIAICHIHSHRGIPGSECKPI